MNDKFTVFPKRHPRSDNRPPMLLRLTYRGLTRIAPRLAFKAGYLWVLKGARSMAAYKRRVKKGELFPPLPMVLGGYPDLNGLNGPVQTLLDCPPN